MVELGEVLTPKTTTTPVDKYTPERGTERRPGIETRYTPVTDPVSGQIRYTSPFTGKTYAGGAGPTISGGGDRGGGSTTMGEAAYLRRREQLKREAEEKKAEEARQAAERIAAERRAAVEKRRRELIEERRAKDITAAQKKYLASLKAAPTAELEVQPYRGIGFDVRAPKDVTWVEPKFGTVAPEERPFKEVSLKEQLKEKEFFEKDIAKPIPVLYQEEADRTANKIIEEESKKTQKNLDIAQKDIQKKIEAGDIAPERGQEMFRIVQDIETKRLKDKVSGRFSKEFSTAMETSAFKLKIKKAEAFRGQYAETFDPIVIKERTKRRLATAVDIGAGVVSGVAPMAGVAYFGAKGIYGGAVGRREDIRMAEIDPITGKLLTPRYMGEIPSARTQEAGMSLLFAAGAGIAATQKIGGQIPKLRAKELEEKPWEITGREIIQEGDEQVLKVYGSKSIGTASAEAELTLPIKVTEKGQFKIMAGRGKVDTRVVDFLQQGAVKPGEDVVKGSLDFNVFGRGVVSKGYIKTDFGNIALKDVGLKVTQGEGYISPDTLQNIRTTIVKKPKRFGIGIKEEIITRADVVTKPEIFKFGGISAEVDDATSVISGKLARARLYPKEGRITGLFKPESFGEIIKREAKEEITEKGFRTFTSGGTKSSKQFFEQLYKTKAEVVGKQITPSILSTAEKGALRTAVRAPSIAARTILSTAPIVTTKVAPKLAPLIGVTPKDRLKDRTDFARRTDFGLTSTSISEGMDVSPLVGVKPETAVSIAQVSAVKPALTTKAITQPLVGVTPGIIPAITMPRAKIKAPVPIAGPPLAFGFEKKKRPTMVKAQPYNAYVKRNVNGKKYVKINTTPLTQESALSAMAREVDTTISARGKIEKIKQQVQQVQDVAGRIRYKRKPQIALNTKDKYFRNNRQKFRTFKTKKKLPLPTGVVIERQKYRLDSRGEIQKIQAAKRSSIGFPGANRRNQTTKNKFRL